MDQARNRQAFLDMIAKSEGTFGRGDNGYNVLFGGLLFNSYTDHPRVKTYEKRDEFIRNGKKDFTTAAGRYQLLARYFDAYKKKLKLPDFSPASQDAIAIQQIAECKALADVDAGRIAQAIKKCRRIWASLPGAGYGQHENSLDYCLAAYEKAGGTIA
jgi:muramidase (phage lysozyme)